INASWPDLNWIWNASAVVCVTDTNATAPFVASTTEAAYRSKSGSTEEIGVGVSDLSRSVQDAKIRTRNALIAIFIATPLFAASWASPPMPTCFGVLHNDQAQRHGKLARRLRMQGA